jgi:hypothetical protein
VASNEAGSATSASATLTVGNTAPALAPVSDTTIVAGSSLAVTNVATDPDVPPQSLSFSMPVGPTNASLDPGTGVFSWRPLLSQGGATYPVTVVVADNGSPSLTATQSFNVTVTMPAQPSISSPSLNAGQFSLNILGDTGPDYIIQASTNLFNWQTIFTTNSPALPLTFSDPNTSLFSSRFYRILLGP